MTDTRDNDPTHYSGTATTFSIPTSGQVNGASDHPYGWIIDWGDGGAQQTVSGASSNNSDGISHTYPSPGEYQITISGLATDGWMDAFGFFLDTGAANTQANKNMFKSIDSPLTDLMRSSNASYRFAYMFFYAHNATGIPANLFSLVSTAGITDLSSMFRGTFSDFARNSTTATIPAGLFGSIDTSSATNLMGMFSNTFSFCAYNSVAGTIPAGLFGSIDTSSATNLTSMFSSTFSYYAFSSTVATVPAGLFGSIDTSRATNLSNMFSSTFNSYAFSSTTATIPAGLFGSIDTSSAINLTSMFRSTFDGYASNSTVGTIPAGLFSSVDTSRAINLTNMFSNTFHSYAASSTVGTIPAGLFDLVDASSATDLSGMFSGTFNGYARVNTTSTTDVNTIWGTVNFAGKVTAANAGGSSGVFYLTFYNVYTLTGAAQTFINTKLGGIIPSSKAYTFFGTRVTDLSSLNDNWK
jgi:IS1 family transposase